MNFDLTSEGKLPAYAWPGGYPIVYLDQENLPLCADCATVEVSGLGGRLIHYEGPPERCEECNAEIESAYGDPEEEVKRC